MDPMSLPFLLGIIFGVLPVAGGVVLFVSMLLIDAVRDRTSSNKPKAPAATAASSVGERYSQALSGVREWLPLSRH